MKSPFAKFVVAIFVSLTLSPSVWSQSEINELTGGNGFVPPGMQVPPSDRLNGGNGYGPFTGIMPLTLPEQLKRILQTTHDAADHVAKLEEEVRQVQQDKPPHFDTPLSAIAAQYNKATDELNKLPKIEFDGDTLTKNFPPTTYSSSDAKWEAAALPALQNDIESLQEREEQAIEMRGQLDTEMDLADRRLKAALNTKELLEKALNPAADYGIDAATWWTDCDYLATAIANYKSALSNRRNSINAGIADLSKQIHNGQAWVSLFQQDLWKQALEQLQLNAKLQQENNRLHQQYEPTTTIDWGLFSATVGINPTATVGRDPTAGQTKMHATEAKQTDGGAGPDEPHKQSDVRFPEPPEAKTRQIEVPDHPAKDTQGPEIRPRD